MQLIKWLVAGVIGGAIGSALWVMIEYLSEQEMNWLSLLVGVLAGLAVRSASGPNTRGYLSGAIAVATTLVAIAASTQGISLIITSQISASADGVTDTKTVVATPLAASDGEPGTADVDAARAKPVEKSRPRVGSSGSIRPRLHFSATKLVLFACAALIAYFLGKEEFRQTAPAGTEELLATEHGDENEHDE